MTLAEEQQLKHTLDVALNEGKPWVAFDEQEDKVLQPFDLNFFSSAGEAERFCDDMNGEWDFVEQMFNFKNFHYRSVASLKASPGLMLEQPVDLEAYARDMAAQNLHLRSGEHIEDLESSLAHGFHHPVTWQRQVDPLKRLLTTR